MTIAEAHPIDPGALNCCYDWEQQDYNEANSFLFRGETFKRKKLSKKPRNDDLKGGNESCYFIKVIMYRSPCQSKNIICFRILIVLLLMVVIKQMKTSVVEALL